MALLNTQTASVVDGQITRGGIAGRSQLAPKKERCVFTVKLAVRHKKVGCSQSATCDQSIIPVYSAWASRLTVSSRDYI